MVAETANRVYTSNKYEKRGEFGEVLLHICIRQIFGSMPLISKFVLKTAENMPVHGFDVAHVVSADSGLGPWLGEAKFYSDADSAIASLAVDLKNHSTAEFLKSEFAVLLRNIDDTLPYFEQISKLLDRNTSLNDVFDTLRFPILFTYDSAVVAQYTTYGDDYFSSINEGVLSHHSSVVSALGEVGIIVHVFAVPLNDLKALRAALHQRLKSAQSL